MKAVSTVLVLVGILLIAPAAGARVALPVGRAPQPIGSGLPAHPPPSGECKLNRAVLQRCVAGWNRCVSVRQHGANVCQTAWWNCCHPHPRP